MAFTPRTYSRHFAVLLLILTCLLIANNAFNRHLHIHNGQIISHAHPYHKNGSNQVPVKSHHHSDAEFLVLDLVTNVQVVVVIAIYITALLIFIREIGLIPEINFIKLSSHSIRNDRAPPTNI